MNLNIFKSLMIFLILGNFMALTFAAETPNFDKVRDDTAILEAGKTKIMTYWTYFVWLVEVALAVALITSGSTMAYANDEGKKLAAKKWLSRVVVAMLIIGAYLGYLYA